MSSNSTVNDNPVGYIAFHQSYELNFRFPDGYGYKDFPSESVKMVHNNLGLEFRTELTVIYPAVLECEEYEVTDHRRLGIVQSLTKGNTCINDVITFLGFPLSLKRYL